MALLIVYRVFHPTSEYTFYSAAHEKFFKIDHILVHTTCKGKRIKIIPYILSDHTAMKLEIDGK